MAESPNLGVVHVEQFQNSKHTTVNTGFDRIDNSLHQERSFAVDDDGDTDIGTTTQFQENGRFECTGSLAQAENINLPAGISRWFFFKDSTTGGFQVTVQVTGGAGAGVDVENGVWYILYTDTTDVTLISKSSPNLVAYSGYAVGSGSSVFGAAQTIMRTPVAFDITFPANFAGNSAATLAAQTTGSTTFDVRRANADGGSEGSIGSIIFAASADEATFTTDSGAAQAFTAGQLLIIRAPGSADASADELGFTLVANKDT